MRMSRLNTIDFDQWQLSSFLGHDCLILTIRHVEDNPAALTALRNTLNDLTALLRALGNLSSQGRLAARSDQVKVNHIKRREKATRAYYLLRRSGISHMPAIRRLQADARFNDLNLPLHLFRSLVPREKEARRYLKLKPV